MGAADESGDAASYRVLRRAAKNVMRPGMRLTCPNCLTAYDVPDDAIAGRARTVRCAHCGHQWRHDAPPAALAAAPAAAPGAAPAAPNPQPAAADTAMVASAPLIDVPPLQPSAPPASSGELFSGRQQAAASRPLPPLPRPAAPAPRPATRPSPPRAVRRRRNRGPLLVLLGTVILLVLVLGAHRPISRAWPASAAVYQALGLK